MTDWKLFIRNNGKEWGILIAGCVIYAISVILLNSIPVVTGGTLGIGIICNKLLALPVGTVNFALNVPIMYYLIKILGKKSLAYTIIIIFLSSALMDILKPWIPPLPFQNEWIVMAVSGVLMGISCGVLMKIGGTFGGSSALVCMMKKHLTNVSSGTLQFTVDTAVLTIGAFLLHSYQAFFLSVAYTWIYSVIIGMIFKPEKSS